MTKVRTLAILLTACLSAPADAHPEPEVADAAIRSFLAKHDIPSAHVTLLRGDAVILQRGYGSVADARPAPDSTSVFPLGSISKQFTAAAILALADEGKLRFDAPVGEYLPEWFAGEPELRVVHLLSQTSGLADFLWLDGYRPLADDSATPIKSYVALGASEPRRFAPGTRWAYSNTNYKALALIAERVTGQTFDEVLATRVLHPLGIDDIVSCHRLQAERIVPGVNVNGKPAPLDASPAAYIGDGGLCASAASLSKWLRRVLASPDETWTRLRQESVLSDGSRVPYGFGLSTRKLLGNAMVWHGGNVDSHSALIAYLPDEELGLIVFLSRGFIWPTELVPALIGARPPIRGSARGAPPAGNFEDGLFQYTLTPEADALQVEIDLIGRFRFIPAGPDEYVAEELPSTFRIRLPTDRALDRFEFDWGEVRSYARRVKD